MAAWRLTHTDGGLWVSRDGGRTWSEVAGLRGSRFAPLRRRLPIPRCCLRGRWRESFGAHDAGATWAQISPPGSHEIHEVESLAVDPTRPEYRLCRHLAPALEDDDGGKNWHNIKQGVIDDSDVFSIIIDPVKPTLCLCSAHAAASTRARMRASCSTRFRAFHQRRAGRAFCMQDPAIHDVVYAGTTEGLYKTVDGGKTFKRMTGPDVIVNDVFVDPQDSNHVLLATDRGGVLCQQRCRGELYCIECGLLRAQGGSAAGGSERPGRLYAGVVNDKSYGGVFVSGDGGGAGADRRAGLEGATSLRWPSRRRGRFWPGPTTASLR